jgi:hypothetical protein
MATRYLQLDWKSSNLYEYNKSQEEGFEKHTSESGNVSYRKYEKKGITGEMLNIGVRDSKIGQQLTMALKDDADVVNVIQFNLYDQRNQVDSSYPESVIAHLGNLKKGETYTVFPYNLTEASQKSYDESTEGREVREKYFDRRAVSFKQDGVKVNTYLSYKDGDKTSVPRLNWTEDRFNKGKKKPTAASLEAKNDFLLDELARAVDGHLAYEGTDSNSSTPSATPPKQETKKEESNKREKMDLPF